MTPQTFRALFVCQWNPPGPAAVVEGIALPLKGQGLNGQVLAGFLSSPTKASTLHADDVEARRVRKPMHLQSPFQENDVIGGRVSEHLFSAYVTVPTGSGLPDSHVQPVMVPMSNMLTE